MAKSVIRRDKKYRRKIDPEHAAKQLALAKEEMQAMYASTLAELQEVEEKTRVILGENAIPSISYPSYLNFVRQTWKLHRSFTGGTLEAEVKIVLDKWASRQLDRKLLEEIRTRVFALKEPE